MANSKQTKGSGLPSKPTRKVAIPIRLKTQMAVAGQPKFASSTRFLICQKTTAHRARITTCIRPITKATDSKVGVRARLPITMGNKNPWETILACPVGSWSCAAFHTQFNRPSPRAQLNIGGTNVPASPVGMGQALRANRTSAIERSAHASHMTAACAYGLGLPLMSPIRGIKSLRLGRSDDQG